MRIGLHKSQVLFYLLVSFILGVFVASVIPVSQTAIMILLIAGIIAVAIFSYRGTFSQTEKGIYKRKIFTLLGFLIIIFSIGVWRFNSFNLSHSYLKEFADRNAAIDIRGYVDGESQISGAKQKFIFKAKEIDFQNLKIPLDERMLITTDIFPVYKYGQMVALNVKPELPKSFDGFDYVTYLKKQGIDTTATEPVIKNDTGSEIGRLEKFKIAIYSKIFFVKEKFQDAVNRSISEPNAAFVNGILIGARQNIPDELNTAFNRTSTTHILAISGYNITIIADILLMVLVWFFRRRISFWISVGLIIIFTILTGAGASVVRAAIMGLLLLFATSYGRLSDAKNSIVLAGFLMILVNPFTLVFDVGFQLSFLAVFGIIYIYPWLDEVVKIKKNELKETAFMTLSAQIFVFPMLMYYFKTFSIVSLPVNILVLPFVPVSMLLGFLAGVGGMISIWLGRIIGYAAWALTAYQLKVISFFGSLSFSSLTVSISWLVMAAIYAVLILLLIKLRKIGKIDDHKDFV